MRRREFLGALSVAAASWPLVARSQQTDRVRRIGVLSSLARDDQDNNVRLAAFQQRLQQLGWTDGHNVRIDYRFVAGNSENYPKYAAELIALAPDVILAPGPSLAPYAPGHPHDAGRVCVRCRSGRLRPHRKSVAAGRQCHWLFGVRIRFERKMAGAA